jgi:hypothetical protein
MGIQIHSKLNYLQQLLPEGLVVDSAWLQQHGYSRQLIKKYLGHGWLESPARTVYRRSGAVFNTNALQQWELLAISLQHLFELEVTAGGRTALELQGYGHYLPLSGASVHLYSRNPLPGWVTEIPVNSKLKIHSARLFENGGSLEFHTLLSSKGGKQSQRDKQIHYVSRDWGSWHWPLIMSTPERAVLELLAEVPQRETFEQADVLIEGLSTLSPKRLNALLGKCRNIKVKRLFMWYAERHKHPWFSRLDVMAVDLGAGKREIAAGGKLDKKYLITVPRELSSND